MLYPLNDYNDVVNAINEFYNIKPALQKSRWMVIESTLKKLDKTATAKSDNPIRQFDTKRVFIDSEEKENCFEKYTNILKDNIIDFNNIVYNTIQNNLTFKDSMKNTVDVTKKYNDMADELIIKYYPELKEYCTIFSKCIYRLINFFFQSMNLDMFNSILDDAEFIANSGVLCDSHIERYTINFRNLMRATLYGDLLDDNTKKRIEDFMTANCDNFCILSKSKFHNINNNSLISYLKFNKRDHEMALVYNNIDNDYKKVNLYIDEKDPILERLYFENIKLTNVANIDDIDILKLNRKGFKPIFHFISDPNRNLNIYYYSDPKTNTKYVVLKSQNENEYYFISKKKKFKVDLKFDILKESLDAILNSTLTITDKYNNF